jgi:hypothetical protein
MQYPMIAQPQYGFAPTMPAMPPMSMMPPAMMAKGGLVAAAKDIQSKGRNGDSMLVHMSPKEVAGLQALAMQHGGSLTINPKTGMPEAFFLSAILPMLAGAAAPTLTAGTALAPLFATPLMTGLTIGGLTALITGDLGKGFSAGLGAYGGAGLGDAFSTAGAAAPANAFTGVDLAAPGTIDPSTFMAETGAAPFIPGAPATVGAGSIPPVDMAASAYPQEFMRGTAASFNVPGTPAGAVPSDVLVPSAGPVRASADAFGGIQQIGRGVSNVATGAPGAREAFMEQAGGLTGLSTDIATAAAPALIQQPASAIPTGGGEEDSKYEGPYIASSRDVRFPTDDERRRLGTSEFSFFNPSNPVPGFEPFRAAKGGSVPMLENGGFVLTKKAVDGLGKGDNKKGQKVASAGLGAIPIRGKGTGTSDSIKTSIDGKRPALVSNGEAYVPKKQVAKHGGAKKFYALMKKAERRA